MGKKRKLKQKTTPAVAAPSAPNFLTRPWVPAVFFFVLSLFYFSDVVLTQNVIYGIDVGTDYHRGGGSFSEKLEIFSPPVWSPKMGGYPQSEEIRHHYFPTHLLNLFTTFHRHLAWRYILTMFLAGIGMYGYLRQLRVGKGAAFWGGVAYMCAPTFLSFPYAGHYAKMSVIALLPVMCLLLEKGMDRGRPIHFAGLSGLIALGVYSPHLQMLYYALWALGFYFLYKMIGIYRDGRNLRRMAGRIGLFAMSVAVGLGLGAEGVFPPYLYTKTESKRAAGVEGEAGKSSSEQLEFARSWSLHPEEIASLVVPEFGGFDSHTQGRNYWGRNAMKINSEYFGVLVLFLALLAVPGIRRDPANLFMGCLFLFALAYALGPLTPVHWLFYHLVPGVKVLRTPGMIAFLFAFPACVLAARSLDRLLVHETAPNPSLVLANPGRRILLIGGGLTIVSLLLALAPRGMTDAWIALMYGGISLDKQQTLQKGYDWLARGGLYVALVAAAGTALIHLRWRGKVSVALLVSILCLLTIADTWRITRQFLRYVDPSHHTDVRAENRRTVAFLNGQDDLFRIFPLPDFNILRQRGHHLQDVRSATGFHDFTPRRYDRILKELEAAHALLAARYYDRQRIPYTDEQILTHIRPLLNLLSAKYIAAPPVVQIESPEFPEVFAGEAFKLYQNSRALPWYYLVPSVEVVEGDAAIIGRLLADDFDPLRVAIVEAGAPPNFNSGPDAAGDRVEVEEYEADIGSVRLRTTSAGPRLLVISENFHTNWRGFVDGAETDLVRANYIWQGVYVPAGDHIVELRYDSETVFISRVIMVASTVVVLVVGIAYLRGRLGPDADPAGPGNLAST